MAVISQIKGTFVSKYVKPKTIARTVQLLIPDTLRPPQEEQPVRRQIDRRCGRDRRQNDRAILLNLRSAHARRKNGRRGTETGNTISGIDTYT